VLIIFGAGKLPQLGEGIGKAIKGFKKSAHEADGIEAEPKWASRRWHPLRSKRSATHVQAPAPVEQPAAPVHSASSRLTSRDRATGIWKPSFSSRPAISRRSAGNGKARSTGDGKRAVKSGIPLPHHAALDKDETWFYFAESGSDRIGGSISGKAHSIISPGIGETCYSGDEGPCGEAGLYLPLDVAFDSRNDLYTCDSGSNAYGKWTMRPASLPRSSVPGSMGSTEMVGPRGQSHLAGRNRL